MTTQIRLLDHATRDDLRVYLERLQLSGHAEVRVLVEGQTMAVFGCTQAPAGLLDSVPVILVLRSFAVAEPVSTPLDATFSGRALLDRLARMGLLGLDLELPENQVNVAWAGVLPPRSGWRASGAIDAASLSAVASQGIARVAEALPDQPGDAIVRQVRAGVWGVEVAPGIPAGAAFAAESMGFLRDESVARVSHTLTWARISTSRGHVMVRELPGTA